MGKIDKGPRLVPKIAGRKHGTSAQKVTIVEQVIVARYSNGEVATSFSADPGPPHLDRMAGLLFHGQQEIECLWRETRLQRKMQAEARRAEAQRAAEKG